MPGVPSGRGCEACRKQKKKCSQETPCARCNRLGISCVGAGQRRFKFQTQQFHAGQPVSQRCTATPERQDSGSGTIAVPISPTNEIDSSVNAFVASIHPSTDLRFNLAWTYGSFLEDIPRRLVSCPNEALRASVAALTHIHHDFCTSRISVQALAKYSRALNKLREYLDDPIKASTAETLCAVMLLLICQGFTGTNGSRWTGHCEGAARMLKARGFYDPKDDFESKLLLSLRGPVVVEGLFNPSISFTPEEWRVLVENHLDGSRPEGLVMLSLAQVPRLFKQVRALRRPNASHDGQLQTEVLDYYDKLKAAVNQLEQDMIRVDERFFQGQMEPALHSRAQFHLQRSKSLVLMTLVIIGCVLDAIDPTSKFMLEIELEMFSAEILQLSQNASQFRPLATSYQALCLSVAWIGATDPTTKAASLAAMLEYQSDFEWAEDCTTLMIELEKAAKMLRLED